MAVGDLAFYYTLYLCVRSMGLVQGNLLGESAVAAILLSHMELSYCIPPDFIKAKPSK